MVNVPQFTMGGHIRDDWMQGAAGITNALGQYHQRGLQNRKIDQDQAQFLATNALARDQFGELKRQHDTTNLLARDKFGLEQAKSPYELKLLQAQAESSRRHGEYYSAQAESAAALAKARNTIYRPAGVDALREDGTTYRIGDQPPSPISGGSGTDGAEGGATLDQAYGDVDTSSGRFGPRGTTPRDVPGVVVTPKGNSDRFATERARGQAGIEAHPDVKRMQQFMEVQETWTRAHGAKPRSGYMYDMQGREVAKGPMSNAADTAERKDRAIGNMLTQINGAEAKLIGKANPDGTRDGTGSSNLSRSLAAGLDGMGPIGRFVQPQSMEQLNAAFGQYQEGILQTVYALSGKQTTNKEMEAFLNLYMPRAGESDKRIEEKTGRLRRMLGTLRSATKKGMIYEDAEREAILNSAEPPAAAPAPNDGWTTLGGGIRIREKK